MYLLMSTLRWLYRCVCYCLYNIHATYILYTRLHVDVCTCTSMNVAHMQDRVLHASDDPAVHEVQSFRYEMDDYYALLVYCSC